MRSIASVCKKKPVFYFALVFAGILSNSSLISASPIPYPAPKPILSVSQASSTVGSPVAFKNFLNAFNKKQDSQALRLSTRLRGIDKKLAAWLIATDQNRTFSYDTVKNKQAIVPNWPGQSAMRRAQEERLVKFSASANLASALPARPFTDDGKILQIRSLLLANRHTQAKQKLASYWIEENFDAGLENVILREFGNLLTQRDHEARSRRLLYDERANGALRLMRYLSIEAQALTKARIAVIRKQRQAGTLLDNLPQSIKRHEDYFFAKAQYLRRQDKWLAAGKVLKQAPISVTYSRDWWIERRLISRKVLEAGNPSLAYEIAANHGAKKAATIVDAEFHSGWYALRFLNAPQRALQHFQKINTLSKQPLSKSRGLYWIARSYKAMGAAQQALQFFRQAATYEQTYYGQLALEELGARNIGLPSLPSPSQTTKNTFNSRDFVRAIHRLNQSGAKGRTGIFYRHLAETLNNPEEMVLLAQLAEKNALHAIALQVGKKAVSRGMNVPRLAFPLGAIPANTRLSNDKKALAYAIARQESAFNVSIISSAKAQGLMQLLPSTARATARSIGLAYRPAKLNKDASYNVRLGSAFLGQLINRFGGSLPLAFAGYNAGPSRSEQWIRRFGDPRRNAIDAIDWVEAIPFSETRNYVQRVSENLQVYRYRLEGAPLTILRELNGGTP